MRISFNMQSGQTLQTLNDKQEQINTLSQELSTGVKLSTPADDPYSWAQSMNTKQGLREYDSILNNITFATGWQQTADSALTQISGLVSQAKQTAISALGASGTQKSTALATQLDGILQQTENLANSQYNGQYIFAGTLTGAAPFSIDASTGNYVYNGDAGTVNVRTDRSIVTNGGSTTINLTGSYALSYTAGGTTTNALQDIADLKKAILAGDTATISSKITSLDVAFNTVNNAAAVNGARLSALDTQKAAIGVFQTNDQGNLSNLQDTDIAGATTKLQQAQMAFQAALQVTSMLQKLNLASVLGASTG
jgi:flagellar hook-associated protein 3 FlgL